MIADNARNLALQDSLNKVAIRRAADAIQQLGQALPCRVTAVSGSIVTVSFEVNAAPLTLPPVTIPKLESQWIRTPTQIGDFGLTVPADLYLGGISGLGGGTADLTQWPPLTNLGWLPVASKSFPSVNTNAACIYGPDGAVIRDSGSNAVITLTPSEITLQVGAVSLVINGSSISLNAPTIYLNGDVAQTAGAGTGTVSMIGPLTVTNEVTGNTVLLSQHVHSGVQPGSGDSGPPVPGT